MKSVAVVVLVLAVASFVFLTKDKPSEPQVSVSIEDVLATNAKIAFQAYADAVSTAKKLQNDVVQLVEKPSENTLLSAKTAWLNARESYGQLEAYRFRLGPIDVLKEDGTLGEEGDGPEGRMNAWPLAEALIDYVATGAVDGVAVADAPANISGNIIADIEGVPALSADLQQEGNQHAVIDALLALNEANGDEANVATGYHAIEFLLWGQDLNEGQETWTYPRDNQAGQRPFTDFVVGDECTSGTGSHVAAEICKRRGNYLKAVMALLITDLERLKAQWNPDNANSYAKQFIAGGETSLAIVLEAMGRLSFGELAGERMNIALTQDSQEDEHSCFSDNTHRDVLLNALGVQNTYMGRYLSTENFTTSNTVSGVSIDAYLRAKGLAENADKLKTALDNTMLAMEKIDDAAKAGMPFDQQIAGGELAAKNPEAAANIRAAINALVAQTEEIQAVITALALKAGDLRQDTEQSI